MGSLEILSIATMTQNVRGVGKGVNIPTQAKSGLEGAGVYLRMVAGYAERS